MKPTQEEANRWILEMLKHSMTVEYYLTQLGIHNHDKERPHDINGIYNKFEWDIIKGMALQYRENIDCYEHIKPAVNLHRKQHHHQMWNYPDPQNIGKPNPEATEADLLTGAVDAICSLMENRSHQPEVNNYSEAVHYIRIRHVHQALWAYEVAGELIKIKAPDLESITSYAEFPNIGVPSATYEKIKACVQNALANLKEQGYD